MFKILVDSENRFSQKCYVPIHILEMSLIKIGDLVSINDGFKNYICYVCPSRRLENQCIFIDDTVSFSSEVSSKPPQSNAILFPDNFYVINAIVFNKITVKLILLHSSNVNVYNKIVRTILGTFIFKSKSTLNLLGHHLAELFNIHSILISDTDVTDKFGKISLSSLITITEIACFDQLHLYQESIKNDISAFSDSERLCKLYLFGPSKSKCRKILISGPAGCGKSVFVKKLCSEWQCHFVMIDGLGIDELTTNKCDSHYKYLLSLSQTFPDKVIVLFIDHIEKCTSAGEKNFKYVVMLLQLIEKLEGSSICIIAAASQRQLVHPLLAHHFRKEIFLGIPTLLQRKILLKKYLKNISQNDIDINMIAGMIPGYLACDIETLIEESVKKCKESFETLNNFSTHHLQQAVASVTPSLLKMSQWNLNVKPIYWKQIGGMDKIKKRLQMGIEWPLQNPEIFHKVNLRCPRGVLLFGPPGCCKTTLARGLATECKANFFAASPAQIYSPFVGESEKNISKLFYEARLSAPSIIFLDELDSLVGRRKFENKSQGIAEKVLSTLLNEMDGISQKVYFGESLKWHLEGHLKDQDNKDQSMGKEVIIIAATNRPDLIDDALLRPGRFDIILYVSPPNLEERKSILLTVTEGMPLFNVNLETISKQTEYFSGADLKNLCNMSAMEALRKNLNSEFITEDNFLKALSNTRPSITRKQIQMYEKLASKYGPVVAE